MNLFIFSEQKELLLQGDIIVINYDTSLISGMYKLKDCLLFDEINCKSVSSIYHYFTIALEAIYYVKSTVFISQHLSQPSIIESGLWLIGENVKGTVFLFEENDCSLASLKLHRTSYNNIGLHLSHSFMVNVLI